MKTLLPFLLIGLLLFVSCDDAFESPQDDGVEVVYYNDEEFKPEPTTRANEIPNSTERYSDIIDQLDGVPIRIRTWGYNGSNVGYLQSHKSKNLLELAKPNDGEIRQRFMMKKGLMGSNIVAIGGNAANRAISKDNNNNNAIFVGTLGGWSNMFGFVNMKKSSYDYYQITPNMSSTPEARLQPASNGSSSLVFKSDINTYRTDEYVIQPVDNVIIEGIRYFKYVDEGDYCNLVSRSYVSGSRNNLNGPKPEIINVEVNETITNSATFQFAQGFSFTSKIGMSSSVSVDGPNMTASNTLSSEYSMGNTYSLTQTLAQSSQISFKTSQQVTVPAGKYGRARIKLSYYTGRLTYYAKIRCGSKILYVKGKYTGSFGSDVEVTPEFYDYVPTGI